MRILVAPNAYKGTLTAVEAAGAIAGGLRRGLGRVRLVELPIADGGDGFADVLAAALRARWVRKKVLNAVGRGIVAKYALAPDGTAIIEMARASGIALLRRRDPMGASTFGTGELMGAALDRGARRIILGIGGSASTDAGTGIARALGMRFLDKRGSEVALGGRGLEKVERICVDGMHPALLGGRGELSIRVACDVRNPLYGRRGAAYVFGPQKGADAGEVRRLDAGLRHIAGVIRRELGVDVSRLAGGGAAGGAGAGLTAFLGATLHHGFDLVADCVGLDAAIAGADVVITGEGRLDASSGHGKAPHGLLQRARAAGVPVIAIGGSLGPGAERLGFDGLFGASEPGAGMPTRREAAKRLMRCAEEVGRSLRDASTP